MQGINQLVYVGADADRLDILQRRSVPNGHKVVLMVVFPSNTSLTICCPLHFKQLKVPCVYNAYKECPLVL